MRDLSHIPPATNPPECSRFVLLKFEWTPGITAVIETLPALVVRFYLDPGTGHLQVNVVPFGDGLPDGIMATVEGAGEPLLGLYLFDDLAAVPPNVKPYPFRGTFHTRRTWCEWEPGRVKG